MRNEIISKLQVLLPAERVHLDEPMSLHTSFRIGGPAAAFVEISNENELQSVLALLNDMQEEYLLLGNGSNVLFADKGYDGVILKLAGDFESIGRKDNTVTVGAAKLLSGTSAFATDQGLAGLEFASGIPGSIGGAVFMNAGAYGGEMKDIVKSVRVVSPDGSEVKELAAEELGFGYRTSAIQASGAIVTGVTLELTPDDRDAIAERVSELTKKRNSKQPVQYPSAGSTFKRPVGGYAAALIEDAGLKSFTVGGAQVSEKHSGFVINIGGATCADVLELMRQVRQKVYDNSGIVLEPEVRIIGDELGEFGL